MHAMSFFEPEILQVRIFAGYLIRIYLQKQYCKLFKDEQWHHLDS